MRAARIEEADGYTDKFLDMVEKDINRIEHMKKSTLKQLDAFITHLKALYDLMEQRYNRIHPSPMTSEVATFIKDFRGHKAPNPIPNVPTEDLKTLTLLGQ
ncbi:hypothetical protein H0H93_001887, partial [Arthromyces matolae]